MRMIKRKMESSAFQVNGGSIDRWSPANYTSHYTVRCSNSLYSTPNFDLPGLRMHPLLFPRRIFDLELDQLNGRYDSVDYYASANMWQKVNTGNIVLTRPKTAFWGIFDPTVTLTLDPLSLKFDAFILAPKFGSAKSLVKFRQQIPKISC